MITANLREVGKCWRIALASDYDLRDRDRIKKVHGARYTDKSGWTVPLTWATCLQLRGVFKEALQLGPDLIAWASNELETRIQPALDTRQALEVDDPVMTAWRGGEKELYRFQEAGVKFLATAKRAYLCDEMGTGKTAQTISTLRYLKATGRNPFPALVVAPLSLMTVWEEEFADWMPEAKVVKVAGGVVGRRKALEQEADVYVINYESVRIHSRLRGYGDIKLQGCIECDKTVDDPKRTKARCEKCDKELNKVAWQSLVVDEAHRLKDPRAKQTRAVWAVNKGIPHVFCLTGTALTEAPHDLWGALHLMEPDAFASRSAYIDRYCKVAYDPYGTMDVVGLQEEHKAEFFAIVDPMMRRMPKDVVLPYLPKKTYVKRLLPMTTAQAKQYKELKDGMLAKLGDGSYLVAGNMLTKATRLDQIASACLESDDEGGYRMTKPSNKVAGLLELLEDMGEEPLVVFSASRQLLELAKPELEKAKVSFSEIVGGMTGDQRDKAKNDFQSGKVRVILCMTGVGGEGLTLTRSGTLCFLQRPWKMSQSKQAEDRIHRIGAEAHDKVTIIDLITPGTIESRRMSKLADKEDRLEEVMRDEEFVRSLLEGEDDA